MNESQLMGAGDILVMYTDGLAERGRGDAGYFPGHLEEKLREVKSRTARQIFDAIEADVRAFGEPADDISLAIIKRR